MLNASLFACREGRGELTSVSVSARVKTRPNITGTVCNSAMNEGSLISTFLRTLRNVSIRDDTKLSGIWNEAKRNEESLRKS
jgi:hypothetical protein